MSKTNRQNKPNKTKRKKRKKQNKFDQTKQANRNEIKTKLIQRNNQNKIAKISRKELRRGPYFSLLVPGSFGSSLN